MNAHQTSGHVAIAGAGVIGLSCAFELMRRGHRVTLFDPAGPRASTSWAAAGMIAPSFESLLHGEDDEGPLTRLCFESAGDWRAFAAAIRAASGMPVGYNPSPTIALARNAQEQDQLNLLQERLARMGQSSRLLSRAGLSARYGVSSIVRGGLELASDHQVDNRRLLTALRQGVLAMGASLIRARVDDATDIEAASGMRFDAIVWARGRQEFGVTAGVKGQALALRPGGYAPRTVLRFGSGYIAPKPDRIVIGATSEGEFAHEGISAATERNLLEAAQAVLPALKSADILESWAGIRPKSANGRPVIGQIGAGAFIAAAHYRNGVLLAPATARLVADMVEGRTMPADMAAFAPPPTAPAG